MFNLHQPAVRSRHFRLLNNASHSRKAPNTFSLTTASFVPQATTTTDLDFPQFQKLPAEIREMVWKLAMPVEMVRFDNSYPEVDQRAKIRFVNRECYCVWKSSQVLQFQDACFLTRFMDPVNDIFLTTDMMLPTLGQNDLEDEIDPLPIRKLLSDITEGLEETMFVREHCINIRKVGQLLDLDALPLLEEFVMAVPTTCTDWWVPGYQIEGPELPVSGLLSQDGSNDYIVSSASSAVGNGPRGDTGIEWPVTQRSRIDLGPDTPQIHPWSGYDYDQGLDAGHSQIHDNRVLPRIGLRGYSQDSTSYGGHWAGFRYYTDTRRVEFSPLAWSEVKDTLLVCQSRLGPLPELVCKIFIVRPGETAPCEQHHCWEEVVEAKDDETWETKLIRGL
ncbi:hypothetical protein G7046_g6014 [Stylonectria norvegica]|nr:hypothetical protein G7046_g6014 [Stylonectria norvegica]